jgi:putative transposase
MQLVEQTVIGKNDPRYKTIDVAAFASKNLYNAALYEVRQSFILKGVYLNYNEMDKRMKEHEAYKALPAKVSQQVLRGLDKNWQGFIAATKEWSLHPEKFQKRPGLPKYKDKVNGRNILVYTNQAISKVALRERSMITPSGLLIEVPTQHNKIDQVRIVPRSGFYVVEIVYEQEIVQAEVNPDLMAGIDIGLNNLATLTANKDGFVPRIVNGRPIKSINQWYNKERSSIQSQLKGDQYTTRRMERLTNKRTRKINHYLHTASRRIIDLLVAEGIGTLVIGQNDQWKQDINIGKRNNQNFVSIPHARFISMLTYKAQLVGIVVQVTEESYTSKCSFLDNEPIKKHDVYQGKRIRRGLFRASDGRLINADVNGAANILRKVAPAAFGQGSRGPVVGPVRLAV